MYDWDDEKCQIRGWDLSSRLTSPIVNSLSRSRIFCARFEGERAESDIV